MRLDTQAVAASSVRVGVANSGRSIAVWTQADSIYASHFNPLTDTWGAPILLETLTTAAGSADVAIHANGEAHAIWVQNDGTANSIYSARYNGSVWSAPVLVEQDAGTARQPQIDLDSFGNAIAVWGQHDGTRYQVRANRYGKSTGSWDATTSVITVPNDYSGHAELPSVAVDSDGNAVLSWLQHTSTNTSAANYSHHIFSSRLVAGGNWSAGSKLQTSSNKSYRPRLDNDGNGNTFVVWLEQILATDQDFVTRRFNADTNSWGPVTLLSSDTATIAGHGDVAVNTNGDAIAVWYHWAADYATIDIWANHYKKSSNTWGGPQQVTSGTYSLFPRVSIDSTGNGIVVWKQRFQTTPEEWHPYTAAFSATGGWGTPLRLDPAGVSLPGGTQVAPNGPDVSSSPSNNHTVGVWIHRPAAPETDQVRSIIFN